MLQSVSKAQLKPHTIEILVTCSIMKEDNVCLQNFPKIYLDSIHSEQEKNHEKSVIIVVSSAILLIATLI